jgi:hypothetical protein
MLKSRLYDLHYGFAPTLLRALICLKRGGCPKAA